MPQKVESGALKGFSGKLEDLNLIIKQSATGETFYTRLPKRLTTPVSSVLQLKYRSWMAVMANNYAPFKGLLNYSFETTKRRQRMRDLFIKYNVKENGCYVTREMQEAGAQILGNFWVSKGPDTLPSIDVRYDKPNSRFVTNIGLGDLVIDKNTTQAQFAKAIGAHNGRDFRIASDETFYADDLSESITLMFAHQLIGLDSKQPSITVETYQIPLLALDESETRKLSSIVPLSMLQVAEVQNGTSTRRCLALPMSGGIEMATVIHSWRKGHEVIRCTSQRLIGPNPLRDQYLTVKACVKSFKSYGPVNWEDNYNPLNDVRLSLLPEQKPDVSGVGTSGLPAEKPDVGDDTNTNPGSKPDEGTAGDGGNSGNPDPTPGEGEQPGGGEQKPEEGGAGQQPGQGGETVEITVAVNLPAGGEPFGSGSYVPGTQQQIGITLNTGWKVLDWSDDSSCHDATRTITVPSHPQTYTVYISEGGSGIG